MLYLNEEQDNGWFKKIWKLISKKTKFWFNLIFLNIFIFIQEVKKSEF